MESRPGWQTTPTQPTRLHLRVPRARNLPRTLLRVPSPFIELHTLPGAPPSHVSQVADRTTSPDWPSFSLDLQVPSAQPPSLGLVVRDAVAPHPPLAQLLLRVDTPALAAWLPLRLDNPASYHASEPYAPKHDVHPAAEVFVVALYDGAFPLYASPPAQPRVQPDDGACDPTTPILTPTNDTANDAANNANAESHALALLPAPKPQPELSAALSDAPSPDPLDVCVQPRIADFPPPPTQPPPKPADAELRAVNPHTGALFRAGTLRIAAVAHGVPTSLRAPFLHVSTAEQGVWGHEAASCEPGAASGTHASTTSSSSSSLHLQGGADAQDDDAAAVPGAASARASLEQGLDTVRSGGKKLVRAPLRKARKTAGRSVREVSKVIAEDSILVRERYSDATLRDVASVLRNVSASSRWRFGRKRSGRSDVGQSGRVDASAEQSSRDGDDDDEEDCDDDDEADEGCGEDNCGDVTESVEQDRKAEKGKDVALEAPVEASESLKDDSPGSSGSRIIDAIISYATQVGDGYKGNSTENGDNNDEEDDSEEQESESSIDEETEGLSDPKRRLSGTPNVKSSTRRTVDFGTFELALFEGAPPRSLKIALQSRAAARPVKLGLLTEQVVELPDLDDVACSQAGHVLHVQVSDGAMSESRVTVCLTLVIEREAPRARCRDVTPRFREVLAGIDADASGLKARFPDAERLTYLFVGGLFTGHYPMYFEKNLAFLQEVVQVARVQTVPIHTEGSLARNARLIRDCVARTGRGKRSVVLLGHSKGGVDALSMVQRYPDVVPFLYGVVTFQSPFGGSFLVDYVSGNRLALSAIAGVIKTLWKGDGESVTDIGYCSRFRSLGLEQLLVVDDADGGEEEQGDDGIRTDEAVTGAPAGENGDREAQNGGAEAEDDEDESEDESATVCRGWEGVSTVPVVAFGSHASFEIMNIRSAANAAGVASMAMAAQRMWQSTGFENDGLVSARDALVPGADVVVLDDMMHTEPALYVQGTKYHPGKLTAAALVLLFEMEARRRGGRRDGVTGHDGECDVVTARSHEVNTSR